MKAEIYIEVVKFPYDEKVRRFGETYSVKQNGECWMSANGGRRRAWSTREAAEEAVLEWSLKRFLRTQPLTADRMLSQ